jgi:cation transport ATPase
VHGHEHDDERRRVTEDTYTREGESKAESLDRHWQELLQELRVAQAGTQILFAFLLTIAFTQAFREADTLTHRVYAVTLVIASLATALLIAPVPFHRMVFRQRLRDHMVTIAGHMATGGLFLLMLAMAGALFLALDVALSRTTAVIIVVGALTWYVMFWYAVPWYVRRKENGHE